MKKSLHTKLLVSMLIATLIPFIISNFITYTSSSKVIRENLIKSNSLLMDSGMKNLKYYLQDLDRMSVSWIYNEQLMNVLRSDSFNFQQKHNLEYELKNLLYANPDFLRVQYTIAASSETYFAEKKGFLKMKQNTEQLSTKMQNTFRIFEIKKFRGNPVLTLHRKIVDIPGNRVLGYLSIYVSTKELELVLQRLHKNEEKLSFMLGNNYFPNKLTESNNKNGILIFEKENYEDIPVSLVKFIPFSSITEEVKKPLRQIFTIQMITVLLMALFIYFVSVSIIKPIKRLIKNIGAIEKGDFSDDKIGSKREDELGLLESRFGEMVRRLNQLINKEYRHQIEITTAQLKMLQAQINPHFLYNTLQSIGTIALKNKVPEIYERLLSLSSIFRYSMDMKSGLVPLKDEVKHTKEYLYLQQGRFKEKLQYDIDCTKGSYQVEVPKMILQPLVENSIVHGVEKGNHVGVVRIQGYLDDDYLILKISDNGAGFTPKGIHEIRNKYKDKQYLNSSDGGIGLLNVLFRIYFNYGDQFDWFIESEPFKTTTITLKIPINKEGNKDESLNR